MKNFIKSCVVILLSLMVFTVRANAYNTSFTANIIQTSGDMTKEGELFVKGNTYLIETTKEGESISILVNREIGKTKLLFNSQEVITEISNTSTKSRSINPFESFEYLLKKYSSREKGPIVVNGYKCNQVEIYGKDTTFMIAYVSKKLNWPVKIESKLDPQMKVELKNIVEKPIGECIFHMSSNYKFVPYSEMKMKKEMKMKEGMKEGMMKEGMKE